jgi:hypothetical protein
MKKISYGMLLFFLLSLLLAAAGRPALAQDNEPTGFKNVTLWVYPEYDNPRLLVMLEGQIDGTTAPATVRFLVPSTAEMYSAGSMDAQHQYSGGPPDRQASSVPGWDEISYQVTSDTFRVEYYDPIIIGQPDKTISYDFRYLYPIANLTAVVQVPKRATDFNVSPAGKPFVDDAGFTVYRYNYTALDPAAPPLHFDISYHKADATPSLAAAGSGGAMSTTVLIVLAGVVVAAAAGVFFWRRRPAYAGRTNRAARRQAVRSGAPSRSASSRPPGGQASRFCTQCGQRLEGSPRFCPNCGKKLS